MVLGEEMLDEAPCGFLSFADDGTVIWLNRTLLRMLGREKEDVVGGHVERLLNIGSRIFYQTHLFPLLRMHGHAEEIFLLLRASDGSDLGVLLNGVRRKRRGTVLYECAVMRVAERQKFEDELLRARRVAEAARGEVEAQREELLRANELLESQAVELELQQQQLQEQTVELEQAGEELRALNAQLAERAEEAERLQAVAEDANEAKSRFLAVMSHELRTPLNAISGYVELLELGIHGPVTEQQLEMLGRIARSQRHLLRLINEVLNLARIESGRVEYRLEDVAAEEIVDSVGPMIDSQVAQRQLRYSVSHTPGLRLRADREKAQQILINLLGNAVKFTAPGGVVQVESLLSRDAPGMGEIRVIDTGIGIPEDKLNSVFQPFIQVDVSHTRITEGTGLGLAISRDLAQGMGGELLVESRPGVGSTFTVRLPLAPEADRAGEAAPAPRSQPPRES